MTKVLVFESDSNFAQTVESGLGGFGCVTTVVSDADAGLKTAEGQPPDLILLSIELPKMNGFSVCNKLKRNKALKDVPLIIMSSDSTDETFEQHKRLRTRAEDYVHKPIDFDALLGRIQQFVALEKAADSQLDEVLIDDDIEIEDAVEAEPESTGRTEEDVDELTDAAFDVLMDSPEPASVTEVETPSAAESNAMAEAPPSTAEVIGEDDIEIDELELDEDDGLEIAPAEEASAPAAAEPAAAAAPPVAEAPAPAVAPPAAQANPELEKLLETERARVAELEEQLTRAKSEAALEIDAKAQAIDKKQAELALLQKEADELKEKLTSNQSAGTAREFLDLRERLNKKDKEILDVRDLLTTSEKEVVNLRDGNIALERTKADLVDRVNELETSQAELQKTRDALAADKEQAIKRGDDFKAKSERLKEELDQRTDQLKQAEARREADLAARDAQEAALREDHRNALIQAAEEAERVKQGAVAEAIAQTEAKAAQAQEEALAAAAEEAGRAQEQALAARAVELKHEHDSKMAALHRANEEALAKLRAQHELALKDGLQRAADQLSAREVELRGEHQAALEQQQKEHEAALATLQGQKEASEAERDARIASLESELSTRTEERDAANSTIEQRNQRIERLEAELATTRAELVETRDLLQSESTKLASARNKWQADSVSLRSAKEALAQAVAQLEEAEARPIE